MPKNPINEQINPEITLPPLLDTGVNPNDAVARAIDNAQIPAIGNTGISWPPGLAGALAAYIYNSSIRPVKEVSIVAALGLIAGIVGKSYTIPKSGLNLYCILVAQSGVGKESLHSGVDDVIGKISNAVPSARSFISHTDFASGPALIKYCAENPSFVNLCSEWGRKMKRLASDDTSDGAMGQLRTAMTDLYQKSGPGSKLGGIGYSSKDSTASSVSGVSYSMIGETTPATFYQSLTESMMEDGFLSRFFVIEYSGIRQPRNKNMVMDMEPNLFESMCALCTKSLTLLSRYESKEVVYSQEAQNLLDDYDSFCDSKINSTTEESQRQLWNRAHLKALRLSALLAAADNCENPIVTTEHAKWALELVKYGNSVMEGQVDKSSVGSLDRDREKKILACIKKYLAEPAPSSYRIPEIARRSGIVPRRFLQARLSQVSMFTKHSSGATKAMDATLESLVEKGYLSEVNKTLADKYKMSGQLYRAIHLPD